MKDSITIIFPIKDATLYSESLMVKGMMECLKKLIEIGALKGNLDDILLNYNIDKSTGYIVSELDKSSLIDASKLSTFNSSLSYPLDMSKINDEFNINDKNFSAASIQERLRVSNLDPKLQFRYIILDYKRYYKSNVSKLSKNPESIKKLKDMFLIDIMGLFTKIMPELSQGKQLAQLTGLSSVSEGLLTISKDLSMAYKRALAQAKKGQISGANFKMLQKKYADFMNLLIPQVFPGIDKYYESSENSNQKSYSDTTFGWVKFTTNHPLEFRNLIDAVKSELSKSNSVKVTIDSDSGSKLIDMSDIKSESIGSIDSGLISSTSTIKLVNPNNGQNIINSKDSDPKSYSYSSDGRIRLFHS